MDYLESVQSSTLDLQADTYIYKIVQCGEILAVISSDDSLSLIDPSTLLLQTRSRISSCNQGVTCLESYDSSPGTLVTCGRDAHTHIWDLRLQKSAKVLSLKRPGFDHDLLSLACDASSHLIATGAEYSSRGDAWLTVWDTRNPSTPFRIYSESHSDDITSLQFHATTPSVLLSGSTDGLVNTYNLEIPDEDEAIMKTFNHGSSIHHARFLDQSSIAALSHDETFTIYNNTITDTSSSPLNTTDIIFNDLRPILHCEYVVDIYPSLKSKSSIPGSTIPFLAAGNTSKQTLTVHPIIPSPNQDNPEFPNWSLNPNSLPTANGILSLKGGHGSEIVRTVYMNNLLTDGVIFTGGEDGLVKAWRSESTPYAPSNSDENRDEDMDDEGSNISGLPVETDIKGKEKPPKRAKDDKSIGSSKSSRYRPY